MIYDIIILHIYCITIYFLFYYFSKWRLHCFFFFLNYDKNIVQLPQYNPYYKNTLASSKIDYCIMLGSILSTLHTLLAVITNRHRRNFAASAQPFWRNVEPSIHCRNLIYQFRKLETSYFVTRRFYRCSGTRPNTGEIRT